MSDHILLQSFYEQPSLIVASKLLGKKIRCYNNYGIIIETEAYIGFNDLASHAARGYTKRNSVMFGPAGFIYVYLIYGIYYCLNIVTEREQFPAAILIRSIILETKDNKIIINGPGKVCKALTITKDFNNTDITANKNICIYDSNIKFDYLCTPRIGISKAKEKFWRFIATNLQQNKYLHNLSYLKN
ncbi:DNA-3-methyladenine glycosylase [Neoehrlichia mikurensis]|uniref:Putative 3-methyladenine DNA glycosylase n=1 Tax=Neoehrlichia mikurensis TaxID=89586 RepID=A0A9Q9C1A5_9RICK|nr:DNA-3-methyladenine glycosylase [Neoehrlichia mikurensis]QXK91697.1 DNA-3-methyladenine glycosylase [Neoehrlichia mikurensis]QXK92908.1 DNA-3-methyladenine glycosylase [Neoehrlichia mikurensis]QXK93388.1 DNA-3-methyladenine glycosylase [Neoehrlichia mikurensis]UTO55664.1 DNA-3-methyladenine glycosylase [Neoehrlichia mikurensis]UTO56584.1 DNA-3-methyladenine glycosylase [Neoehrlichia mikurensis]